MSGTIMNLIVEMIAGVVGGNAAGAAAPELSLGTVGIPSRAQSAGASAVSF
jgi:hypothetical protein